MAGYEEGADHRRLVARKAGEASRTGRPFLWVEWNSTDMWNLDMVLADIIADALNEFRHTSRETGPNGLTEDEWDAVLGEMIVGFEAVREERAGGSLSEDAQRGLDRALDLLKKHFRDLNW